MSENKKPSYFAAATDQLNRWDCAGGGVLQLIAKHILNSGGKVCAPVFTDDFRSVEYIVTDSREDIYGMPEIQYIKSYADGCFDEIKRCLESGITVLFVGAPCEIKKLKVLFKKDNKETDKELAASLYTVGLWCKGAASVDIWKSWLESIEAGTITGLRFGAKELNCSESIRIQFDDDREKIYNETASGLWFTAYNSGLLTDRDCKKCSTADANIFLAVLPDNDRNFNDGKGATFVSINDQKGEQLFDLISPDISFKKEIPEDKAMLFTAGYSRSEKNEKAVSFYRLCREYGYKTAMKKMCTTLSKNHISYILNYHAGDGKPWSAADNEVWNRPFLHDGYVVLKKCSDKWQRIFLPLDREMEKGKIYCYDIKFRAMTTAKDIYFQVTTEATNDNTFTEGLGRTPSTEQWTRAIGKFTCILGGHKYFDISSAVLTGSEKMIFIDWIRIWEE